MYSILYLFYRLNVTVARLAVIVMQNVEEKNCQWKHFSECILVWWHLKMLYLHCHKHTDNISSFFSLIYWTGCKITPKIDWILYLLSKKYVVVIYLTWSILDSLYWVADTAWLKFRWFIGRLTSKFEFVNKNINYLYVFEHIFLLNWWNEALKLISLLPDTDM